MTGAGAPSSTSGTVDIGRLLAEHPVVDGHNDLLWTLRQLVAYNLDELDVGVRQEGRTHTDLPRLREGGVGAQFWSVFVPSAVGERAVAATLEQIDAAYALMARYDDQLAPATTANEVERAWATGRIACLMGAEGGHQIGDSLAVLRMFHQLGVRYLTLTHNENNDWADSATDEPVHGGLTDFGRDVVREMNRIGMMVDLSHVSADVMRQALEVSTAPVMFSHSSARAACDHVRNVPDDVLASMGAGGGLCMVTFVPRFVSPAVREWVREAEAAAVEAGVDPKDLSTFEPFLAQRETELSRPVSRLVDVVAHVEHVRDVAGIDHVGLGGDYDGVAWLPQGLEDVTGYPRLLGALADRGWSSGDLAKLTCRNVLRTMREVEDAATA